MSDRPVLFLVHGLGCSARTWDPVVAGLADTFDCVALDLPGHGAAAGSPLLTVEEMATWLTAEVLRRRPARWALVGHSMGGKIATIVTGRAERGLAGLSRPLALVLVAASPLDPEPMDEQTRSDMIGWCADGAVSAQDADTFVDANTAGPLPTDLRATAVADVGRVSRTAWTAWLERGSREDWSSAVDVVRTPTLVVAGTEDGPLGADGQRALVLPHVAASEVTEVDGAAHLIMLEQPVALSRLISEHVATVGARSGTLAASVRRLIDSDRVSTRTREALLDRLPEPTGGPHALDDRQRTLLGALLARVVPQRGTDIDLAARIDASLASGATDGWRFAELPADADAWRQGLDTLAAVADDFVGSSGADQDRWIEQMIAGRVGSDGVGHLSPEQMTLWFEDVRAEAVRTWLSHPAAQARIGYDGFANGGDGARKQGYLQVAAGARETWQLDLPVRGTSS